MFPTNQNFVSANAGLSNGNNPCFPMYLTSAPTTTGPIYAPYGIVQLGQIAIVPGVGAWICIGLTSTSSGLTASWEQMVTTTGNVLSVTGTANQIQATPSSGTGNVVLSLIGPYTPATYTLDGVLYGNGTSSIGATAAGTTGQILTANTGSAPTWTTATFPSTVAAGALLVGTASNVVGSIADVATGQALMSGGVGVIPAYTGSPSFSGSVTAATTLTATLGNITATNGNLSLATAGNKIVIATGSNASVGTSAAMSGTPGAVTVATTASSSTAKIFYSRATTGGTPGQVSITAQDGTGFTLTSTGNETSTFNWWIINA